MTSNDLKTRIRAHLATANEATAKQIAKAVGHADYPTVVISALSEMRTDAEVECEKKTGKGNEYWYWLTNVGAASEVPAVPNSRTVEPTAVEVAANKPDALRDQLALAEKQRDIHFAEAEAANQKIAELEAMLSACAESSAADMKRIADLEDDIRRQVLRASAAEANRDDLKKERDGLIERNVKLRAECDELFIKLGDTEIELASAKDVKEAAIGYLVRTPGKPSKMRTKPESAHAAAMSSARVHGKAEVLALVPVGKAVRGAEWKEAA